MRYLQFSVMNKNTLYKNMMFHGKRDKLEKCFELCVWGSKACLLWAKQWVNGELEHMNNLAEMSHIR